MMSIFLCQLLHHDRVITQCTACWTFGVKIILKLHLKLYLLSNHFTILEQIRLFVFWENLWRANLIMVLSELYNKFNRSWCISTTPKTTKIDHFQTYTLIYYGHSELSRKEKSKFDCEEKSSVTKKGSLQAFLP